MLSGLLIWYPSPHKLHNDCDGGDESLKEGVCVVCVDAMGEPDELLTERSNLILGNVDAVAVAVAVIILYSESMIKIIINFIFNLQCVTRSNMDVIMEQEICCGCSFVLVVDASESRRPVEV